MMDLILKATTKYDVIFDNYDNKFENHVRNLIIKNPETKVVLKT